MKKNRYLVTRAILYSILLVMLHGCDNLGSGNYEPDRPDNIPGNTLWIGGTDGGVFIRVNKMKEDKPYVYDAEIYFGTGDIDFKGKLTINTRDKPVFDYDKQDSYSGWDGDTLYLRDGRRLAIYNGQ